MSALTRTLIGASALPLLTATVIAAYPRTETNHVFPTNEAWLWKDGDGSFTRVPLPHPVTRAALVALRDGSAALGDLRWSGGRFVPSTTDSNALPPAAPPTQPAFDGYDPVWLGKDRWFIVERRSQDIPVRSATATNNVWAEGPAIVLHGWENRAVRIADGTIVTDQYGDLSIARPTDAAFRPLAKVEPGRQTLLATDTTVYAVTHGFPNVIAQRIDLATGSILRASPATGRAPSTSSESTAASVPGGILVAITFIEDAYDRRWLVPNVAGAFALPAEILFLVRFLRRRPGQPDRRPYFFIGVALGGAALFGFAIWVVLQVARGLGHM